MRSLVRPRSPRIAVAVVAIAIATAGSARADDPPRLQRATPTRQQAARAAVLRQRGLEHYLGREYQLAADDLMEAYRLDKRAQTLLGWAEAVRATGDCALALRIYRRLLDKTSDLKLTRQAEEGLAACEAAEPALRATAEPLTGADATAGEIALIPPGATATEAPPASKPPRVGDDAPLADDPEPAPLKPAAPPAAIHSSTTYILLGIGGVASLGGLLAYAGASDGTGTPGASHADVTSARSAGDWQRLISASIAVSGTGVAVFGLLRYRSENRAAADRGITITPYVGSGGAGVLLTRAF